MRVLEVYTGSEAEAGRLRQRFEAVGEVALVRVVKDPWLKLPAARTDANLYEGTHALALLLTALERRRRHREAVIVRR